ncbi:MAG: ABC transporter ATP-binding protein [Planctomycetota bacterium]|nr:ABC transporter ATP-binding protein [Planctomycetota bacterium]
MGAMIEIKGLTKSFGPLLAVDAVSFTVDRGEVLGFLGPNGAGKSTTMKMVTGFLSPTSGEVKVCGHDIDSDTIAAKSKIGYLPEGAPAYPDMTPLGFLRFVAEIRGYFGPEREERVAAAASKLHLEEVMHQPIDTLSKGFKRRVALAQAILHDPPVLVLDEPTDGLDPNQKHEVRGLIRAMAKDKAIVLSTHILEEVEAVCTRVIIINRGSLVFDGTPEAFDAVAPADVQAHRLDWVFRSLTTSETDETAPDAPDTPDTSNAKTAAAGSGGAK